MSGSASKASQNKGKGKAKAKETAPEKGKKRGGPISQKTVEEINLAARDLGAVEVRERQSAVYHAAFLGTFRLRVALDEAGDGITAKYVNDQRSDFKVAGKGKSANVSSEEKGDSKDVTWLLDQVRQNGRTSAFTPITVAVEPENISPVTNAKVKELKVPAQDSPAEYANKMRLAMAVEDTERQKRIRVGYHAPVVSDKLLLEMKPTPTEVARKGDPIQQGRFKIHLLDGQRRMWVVRRLQKEQSESLSAAYTWIEANVLDWTIIRKEPNLRLDIINREPLRQHRSEAVDELRRTLNMFMVKFPQPANGLRTDKTIASFSSASGKKEARHRTAVELISDMVITNRAVRATLMDSVATRPGNNAFAAEPLAQLFSLGLPEFVTFSQSLWTFQQRLISTVFTTNEKGTVYLQSLTQLVVDEVVRALATMPLPEDAGLLRKQHMNRVWDHLDKTFHYNDKIGGLEHRTEGDDGFHAGVAGKWAATPFGRVEIYVLVRAQVMYAIFGPHTEGYLPPFEMLSGDTGSVTQEEGFTVKRLPTGRDPNFGLKDPSQQTDNTLKKLVTESNRVFVKRHGQFKVPVKAISSFSMLGDPTSLNHFLRQPGMTPLLKDVAYVFEEMAAMVDPLYMLAFNSVQKPAIEGPAEVGGAGFLPMFVSDDSRDSIFKPFWGAVLASLGNPCPSDDRYQKNWDGGDDMYKNLQSAQAMTMVGTMLEELFAYVVQNAQVMANELRSARKQAKTVAGLYKKLCYHKGNETAKGLDKGAVTAEPLESFYARLESDPKQMKTWGQARYPHSFFWAAVTDTRIQTTIRHNVENKTVFSGSKPRPSAAERHEVRTVTVSHVKRQSPAPAHVVMLMEHTLARVYTVHQSVHWHHVRTSMSALESGARFVGLSSLEEEPFLSWGGTNPEWRGYFGQMRGSVPMMHRHSWDLDIPMTFRLRDRSLLAAWLPALAPLGHPKAERNAVLRVEEATVIRLWEPVAGDYADVLKASRSRPAGTIAMLDGLSTTDPKDITDLVRAENAIALPERTRSHLKATADVLKLKLPTADGVPHDFRGTPVFADWNAAQGDGWVDYLFGRGLQSAQGPPSTTGVTETLIEKLRVVPNEVSRTFFADTEDEERAAVVGKVGKGHHRLLDKVMLWEGLGPSLLSVPTPKDMNERAYPAEMSFFPLLHGEYVAAWTDAAGSMLMTTWHRVHIELRKAREAASSGAAEGEAGPVETEVEDGANAVSRLQKTIAGAVAAAQVEMRPVRGDTVAVTKADRERFPNAVSTQSVMASDKFMSLPEVKVSVVAIRMTTWLS
ncbi:hypothetical protein A4X13_0g8317 [Tilletia indica]|uniref:Uncharacterized protein n=1 Tax=Tilletia indica TaxID=43049 RepID=A0A8T8SFF1_9BASI|nr:hypothetical protein A4X13_0g8317 [Tilletia indica]